MSNQQNDLPSEPPPSYDSILDQRRPVDAPAQGQGQASAGGGAATTSAASAIGGGASSSTNNAQSTGVDTQGNRVPKRHDSAHEELDVEEEDRPLPPGWVVQFSEKDDRE